MADLQEIAGKLGELGVTIGMVEAVMPEEAKDGWEAWTQGIVDYADEKIQEAIEFGSAYDD